MPDSYERERFKAEQKKAIDDGTAMDWRSDVGHTVDPDVAASDDSGDGGLFDKLFKGVSLFTGVGAVGGLVGGLLDGVLGGSFMQRIEDPITTEARKRLTSARDTITNVDPEANRRMTDQSLAAQQGAGISQALNASSAQLANQGVGGDIASPMQAAVTNSTAAVGAAGQFAGARTQNNMHALDAELDRAKSLSVNAEQYGALAKDVNLHEKQSKNFGSTLLRGIAGAGSGGGIFNQLGGVLTDKEYTLANKKDKP